MNKQHLENTNVKDKKVFVRVDFNVPLQGGEITDDTRIKASLPTLKYLIEQGARIVCASHLGRPKGKIDSALSLRPVAERLGKLLGQPVRFAATTTGPEADQAKRQLKKGEVLLLENLRFTAAETDNDDSFARQLANEIDVFINDAFGACHRSHASITAITRFAPLSVAGFLLKKEIDYLSMAVDNPPANYVVILGGAKVADKIPVITNLLNKARAILIGGAMAYTFLKTTGMDVGNSRVEPEYLELCSQLISQAEAKGVKLLLPVDHVAAIRMEPNITVKMTHSGEGIPGSMMGLDIGAETIDLFTSEINQAELIVWNGPLGVFEISTFSAGTSEIAKAIAHSKATSIVGGGDSIAAINQAGIADKISHISTGGGASLEYLAGKMLPGIESLTGAK
jgi:phosphoglycerate kinase